ncbi:MAG: cytochrome C biogenesis protein [bacterium]|nr:cytochrome C biogenesis protein [bacterium]
MDGFVERINEWGYALSQTLQGQLDSGSISALGVAFAAGVLTSFTPCVYPMIPVTVTFIGGAAAGSRRKAFSLSAIYAVGLALVYATLGVVTALVGGVFGQLTRSPWIFGAVALIILLFGLAMLDWITIPIPGFAGKVQTEGASRGGYLGALLMGAAAGFVAAPCTAPVLGVLLFYVASSGNPFWGGALLLAFSIGLSLLLLVLGIFSGMLSSLPAAGRWMDWVKKGFGVAMLLVGAWFVWKTIQIILGSA